MNVPEDFAQAVDTSRLTEFFAECTDAHRREYLKWIAEAKRPETRAARIQQAIQMLAAKRAEEEARARRKVQPDKARK